MVYKEKRVMHRERYDNDGYDMIQFAAIDTKTGITRAIRTCLISVRVDVLETYLYNQCSSSYKSDCRKNFRNDIFPIGNLKTKWYNLYSFLYKFSNYLGNINFFSCDFSRVI